MKTYNDELVRTCYECRGTASGRRENYNYSECGLNNVVLKGVVVYRCARCGSAHVEIPNMDGLHRTIALLILEKSTALSSAEIRFLRTLAGFTATQFAKALGVTKTALSRWENNQRIGTQSDRSIRIICGFSIIEEIVNDQTSTGAVDIEMVQKTLAKIKHCLIQVAPRSGASKDNKTDADPGRLLIDPEFPYASSVLAPAVPGAVALIQ